MLRPLYYPHLNGLYAFGQNEPLGWFGFERDSEQAWDITSVPPNPRSITRPDQIMEIMKVAA